METLFIDVEKSLVNCGADLEVSISTQVNGCRINIGRFYHTSDDMTYDLTDEITTLHTEKDGATVYYGSNDPATEETDPHTVLGDVWNAIRQKISECIPDHIDGDELDEELEVDPFYPNDSVPYSSSRLELCY